MSDNELINSEIDAFAIRNGLTDAACYAIKCICRAEKDKEYRNVRSEAGLIVVLFVTSPNTKSSSCLTYTEKHDPEHESYIND